MSFVDDVAVFGEVLLQNVRNMLNVIEFFCRYFGQRINFAKSQFIAANNLSPELYHFLVSEEGVSPSNSNLKHLGFPYIQNARYTRFMYYMVNKISNKIESWTTKPLSQAG